MLDVYVYLTPLPDDTTARPKLRTEQFADAVAGDVSVFLDYNADGEVCGIEILSAAAVTANGKDIQP